MTALVIGGSGSGKSAFAEEQVSRLPSGKRVYLATMRVFDEESEERVRRHRAQRARLGFRTLEWPMDLLSAPVEPGSTVLLEDLTNLMANERFRPDGGGLERAIAGVLGLSERCGRLICVTGDLCAGGRDYLGDTLGYLRDLARLNRAVAAKAEIVAEIVAGVPNLWKGEFL